MNIWHQLLSNKTHPYLARLFRKRCGQHCVLLCLFLHVEHQQQNWKLRLPEELLSLNDCLTSRVWDQVVVCFCEDVHSWLRIPNWMTNRQRFSSSRTLNESIRSRHHLLTVNTTMYMQRTGCWSWMSCILPGSTCYTKCLLLIQTLNMFTLTCILLSEFHPDICLTISWEVMSRDW